MKKTNGNATSNKYWENEKPIITETDNAQIRYFKEAGKIQLYPMYEDKDGEMQVGRGCTWDNNNMDEKDAVKLAFGVMQGLLDCGIENNAFADAYALLEEEVGNLSDNEDDVELDEEIEDEFDLSSLDLVSLKKVAKELGLKILKKDDEDSLIEKIEECDEDDVLSVLVELGLISDDEDETDEDEEEKSKHSANKFVGKHVVYMTGKCQKTRKAISDDYIDWCDDVLEWTEYIHDTAEEINAMPEKTKLNKQKKDKAYAQLKDEVTDWVNAWEDKAIIKKVSEIVRKLMLLHMTVDEANCKLVEIVDGLEF